MHVLTGSKMLATSDYQPLLSSNTTALFDLSQNREGGLLVIFPHSYVS